MKRIKDVITPEVRISLFQTAMNNAGRNFEGKRVGVAKMAKFAAEFYKLAIHEIGEIGKMELQQLEKIVLQKETKKCAKIADAKKLLKRIKRNGKNRKAIRK